MNGRKDAQRHLALVFAIAVLTPSPAAAQAIDDGRPPVMVSVGGGVLMPYSYPERPTADLFVSVQVPVSKSLILEGQVVRSTSDHTRSGYFDNRSDRPFFPFTTVETNHEALNVGGNLLMRTGGRRLKLFFGGGAGFHDAETRMRFDTRCEPRVAGGCDGRPDTTNEHRFAWSGPSWQLVGGVDARIAPRLTAFGSARWLTTSLEAGDTGLGALGGIRVALRDQETADSRPGGPAVRVRFIGGDPREGELVSLTSSDVVIARDGQTQTFPLDQVSRVERTTHHVRNGVLWGLVLGFAGGYFGSCGGGDEEDCWPEVGALFAGIGAGTGALIGAGINRATAESRVLYSNPAASVSMAPRVSPSRAGVELTVAF
jgi:hypothetical protein